MFTYRSVIRLHHTDAAGVVFFVSLFALAHECYEAFLDTAIPLGQLLDDGDIVIPIVHADADFKLPLRVSDPVRIEMVARAIGQTSFALDYVFRMTDDSIAAQVSTVHAAVSKASQESTAVPEPILAQLRTIAVPS